MNMVENAKLFTELTPEEASSVNGGWRGGHGGCGCGIRYYCRPRHRSYWRPVALIRTRTVCYTTTVIYRRRRHHHGCGGYGGYGGYGGGWD